MFGGTSLFGNTNPSQTSGTTTNLFGTPGPLTGANTFVTAPNTSFFGSPQPVQQQNQQPVTPQTSLFSTPLTSGPATGNLFKSQQPTTSGLFGTQTNSLSSSLPSQGGGVTGSSSLFGNSMQQNTGLFGTTVQSTASNLSNQQSSFPLFSSSFNTQPQTTTTAAIPSLFGQQPSSIPVGFNVLPEVQKVLGNLNNADVRSCQTLTDTFKRLKALVTEPPILVCFTYEIETDPRQLSQKRLILEQQISNLNNATISEAYSTARDNNPDLTKYTVVPIQGFEGIVARTAIQSQHLNQLEIVLQELKNRQDIIRNHIEIHSLKRVNDIAKRQKRLMSNVMKCVGELEEYALKHSIAQLDITFFRKLQTDLTALSEEFKQSQAGRLCLTRATIDIQYIIDSLLNENTTVSTDLSTTSLDKLTLQRKEALTSDNSVLSDRDIKTLKRIIHKQKTLFESLETALRIDNLKAKKLLQIAEHLATSSPQITKKHFG